MASKRKRFCPLDYEHVCVTPLQDGLNDVRVHVTNRDKLRSLGEWIDTSCENMKDFLTELGAFTSQETRALSLMESYRDILVGSFPPESFQLLPGVKLRSRRNKRRENEIENGSDEEDSEDSEDVNEEPETNSEGESEKEDDLALLEN